MIVLKGIDCITDNQKGTDVLIRAGYDINSRENGLCGNRQLFINLFIVPSLLQLEQYITDARKTGRAIQIVLARSEDHVTNQPPIWQTIGVNERPLHFDHSIVESAQFCKTWFVKIIDFLLQFISKSLKKITKLSKNCFVVLKAKGQLIFVKRQTAALFSLFMHDNRHLSFSHLS